MVNEVKFDNLTIPIAPKSSGRNEQRTNTITDKSDITITNQLSSLVNSVVSENHANDDVTRIAEMKHRIESNAYRIDSDALAKKLYHDIFASSLGG